MADSQTLHAVIFRIGALNCAAPAGIVREILPRLPATRIPGVAEAIEGLVNVRGTLLTVLDAHVLLQQERRAEDEGAIVVVDVAGRRYGLGVGQVLDFLEEQLSDVAERMATVARRLDQEHPHGDVVIVSHQDAIQAGRLHLTGAGLDRLHEDRPTNGAVITLRPGPSWREETVWEPGDTPRFGERSDLRVVTTTGAPTDPA